MTHTLAAQQAALDAVAQLGRIHGHLPGATISLTDIWPSTVSISLDEHLDAFEAWREALGIPADAVEYTERPSGMNLKAEGSFAGATVELSGYAPRLSPAETVTA